MRVPLSWLKDYVDIELDPVQLADRLTMTGTKVEALIAVGENLRGIIACRVAAIEPHPTSPNLKVATLDAGPSHPVRKVVTAAGNVGVGDVLPVVIPGGRLADGSCIGQMDFAGITSEGMLCSARELGVAPEADGILHLPEGVEPGSDVVDLFSLNDTVIELEITPNRPDCLCMLGVAREVAAITCAQLRMPEYSFAELEEDASALASVEIAAPDLCARYGARLFRNIMPGQSPIWMQARLSAAGIRPINNVVDVTNYVMLELNQPLHAFDFGAVRGGKIVVRRASKGERLITLDGVERQLDSEMLVIADPGKALAVAGVMGGQSSEITESTSTVLLESATFLRQSIWRTSRDIKLRSEASSRFEKGLDPATVPLALDRTATLLQAIGAGQALRGAIDAYPAPAGTVRIVTTPSRIDRTLGAGLGADEIRRCLVALGFGVNLETGTPGHERISVDVPSFRGDVCEEIDLAEEVARIWGYNNVATKLPGGGSKGGYSREYAFAEQVRNVLNAAGATEAMTSPFMADADFDALGFPLDDGRRGAIRISNPMVEELSIMRTTMIPSMLASVRFNVNRSADRVFLFEIGRVYFPSRALAAGEVPPRGQTPAEEKRILVGAMTGLATTHSWHTAERQFDFFDAKGAMEALLDDLGIASVSYVPTERPPFHPGRAASILVEGQELGVVGQLHPDVAGAYSVPGGTLLFEVDLDVLMQLAQGDCEYKQLPRFPAIERDIALVVSNSVLAHDVEQAIAEAGGELVESVDLFDVYSGPQVGEGRRSLAFTVTFRSDQRTLTDDEVNERHTMIRNTLAERFSAALR